MLSSVRSRKICKPGPRNLSAAQVQLDELFQAAEVHQVGVGQRPVLKIDSRHFEIRGGQCLPGLHLDGLSRLSRSNRQRAAPGQNPRRGTAVQIGSRNRNPRL